MKTLIAGGMRVTQMTLGTVQLGMAYGVANTAGKPSRETAFAVLDAARQGGVACLDTARLYGDSEQVIGAYLAERPGADLTIVTKFRIDPSVGRDRASVFGKLEASVRASLEALGIGKLPLLLLHNADDMDEYGAAVPDALRMLMERGLIERAGVSVYEARQIDRMLEENLYTAVQLPVSVLDRRLIDGGRLDALRRAGCAVFARSVFLQGLFFMDDLPAGFAQAAPFVRALRRVAAREGLSVAQLALSAVRDLPGVTSLVLGAETPGQAAQNAALFDAPPLSPGLRDELAELGGRAPIEEIMAEIRRR